MGANAMEHLEKSTDLRAHQRALFALCYRLTGNAADAEDLVQETFRRALERPPSDLEAPLRPWLTRVATNLGIDLLRKRKRERYFGPWLPSPIDLEQVNDATPGPEARYGLQESASMAFLVAMEALDPRQRAVVVLRDVLGMSGPEAAAAIETSPGNVRVLLHRARQTLATYDATRIPIDEAVKARTAGALRELLAAMALGDFDRVLTLLAEDVRTWHDGGGEVHAAVRVVSGREEVTELYRNLMAITPAPTWFEERELNGLPAIVMELPDRGERYGRRMVMSIELDRHGRVRELRAVLASRKLTAVAFASD